MSDCLSVYVTTPSFDVADTIGRALVEERLAACVNIFPSMHSIYRRQGKIETAIEVVLIAKSRGRPFRGKASAGTAPLRLPLPCRRVTIA
jgi:periplasmic divalent cation tolerance protein